jgi:hypothetical protein
MKFTTLFVTAAVLALAGPAMAFGPSDRTPIYDGLDRSNLSGVGVVDVQCYPVTFDPRDRSHDRVTHTDIDVTFQSDGDLQIQSFVVTHNLASGRVVNRDTQYSGTTWKKLGFYEWYWEGRQYDNPRISMRATLLRTARGQWTYQEVVYKDGRVDHVIPAMMCSRSGD